MSFLRGAGPLAGFLLGGLLLYLILDASGFGAREDQRIRVDAARLAEFHESRGGQEADTAFADLPEAQQKQVLRAYLREEALYREALALGLDRGDSAIRRRLVQSLRFSLADEAGPDQTPSEAELRRWFVAHKERYRAGGARLSFVHVYFDAEKRGPAAAMADARTALASVPGSDWLAMGDRFAFARSYSSVPHATLAAEWSKEAADRLSAPAQPIGQWFGPVQSQWGAHLVRIDRRDLPREPGFEEQRTAVLADWQRAAREARAETAIDAIVASYPVTLSGDIESLRE